MLTFFQQHYPEMEMVLFEGTMQEVGEWIGNSIIDVGFVILPARGIDTTLLTADEICVLIPPGHHLQSQKAVTSDQLREEGFIMEKSQCALQLMGRFGVELNRGKPHKR